MLTDAYNRPVKDLRISVTDRCNFRCAYCMPLDEYVWIDRHEILTFEEISRIARLFTGLGVEKIRITGGEPLVRKDLHRLIGMLSNLEGVDDLCLTTNASLLTEQIDDLAAAGLKRINVIIERGTNEDDIIPLVEFSREHGFTMRFIEYMDVGNANNWISEKIVSKKEILERIN